MILHLGVIDIPYAPPPSDAKTSGQIKRDRRNAARAAFGVSEHHGTTGDVAQMLEDKYHVMEHFWQAHGDEAAAAIADDMSVFLEDRLSGSGANAPSFVAAEGAIRTMFNVFIDTKEMDGLGYPGIPTAAARGGVNHRLKHPYAKDNPERPSFRDTGLFEGAFRAWLEQ